MKILGIHDGHNASVALLEDGKIVAAIQEERLTRIKNHDTFPSQAVQHVLENKGLTPDDIDIIAFNGFHMPKNVTKEETLREFYESQSVKTYIKRLIKRTPANSLYRSKRKKERIKSIKSLGFTKSKVLFVEHHMAHASAAYWGSPWRDNVLIITNDGAGDNLCATINIGDRNEIKRIYSVSEDNSIALIYAMITFLMGMVPNEHEYKIMGLAPYATSDRVDQVYKKFRDLLEFDNDGLTWHRKKGIPHTYYSYKFFLRLLERDRFDLIAAGLQKFVEDFLTEWISNAIKITGIRRIALSGGIFMNVKANKKISEIPEAEEIFIFPSSGDESNAIGAAYWAYVNAVGKENANISPLEDIYLGFEYDIQNLEESLTKMLSRNDIQVEKMKDIEKTIAELLAKDKVVARCKGRMEFGARALGNRSILANPSNPDIKRIINDSIKMRDFWMPFAPSILEEDASRYLINPKEILSPYMMMSFNTKPQHCKDIIAAIHPYDLTARPQIVYKEWNPDYYRLISEFKKITGIGVVLNTSFNLHGYPIVYSPYDAIRVFLHSGLKYLALGEFLLSKSSKNE